MHDHLQTDAASSAAIPHPGNSGGRRSQRRGSPWMPRIQLNIAAIFMIIGLWLTFVQPWLDQVTMPHARHGALWRTSLPGLDLGLDAHPAAPGQYGYVELWAYPHDADDIQPLIHLFGTPALPL